MTDATGRVHWSMDERSGLTLGWLLLDDSVGFNTDTSEESAHARYRDEYVWLAYDQNLGTNLRSRTTLALAAATRKRNGSVQPAFHFHWRRNGEPQLQQDRALQ